ncbi:ogr/Delta-like zinc finger family protein [Salmonella enterica subsp. enterica]|nr:ogr/Delta-like zinc finger family protein [Salmonella enterica subsp. enterica serovar Heidelberg]
MRIQIRCPHCDGKAIARSSRELSPTLRQISYQCIDPECGHTYLAHLEIVRTLSPSAKPNAAITLPYSPHIRPQPEPEKVILAA